MQQQEQQKPRSALDEVGGTGAFIRTASAYVHRVEASGRFAPEADRYHLYISLACPWAAGVLSTLFLKGLEHVIGYSVVHPTWQRTRPDDPEDTHAGWVFRAPGDAPLSNPLGHGSHECDEACRPDTVMGCQTVRELYELSGDTAGKFTTPLLFCKKEKAIVNNESTDILRILNDRFNEFAKHPEVDLYPAAHQHELDELNKWIYPTVNNGVYRCGFARTQEAYDEALAELFASLDRLDEHLSTRRFLSGQHFSWLDLRLYHTLVRFDPVYHTYFKTNLRRIQDYKHLPNYVRDIYQTDAIKRATNLKHIKMHYYTSHPMLNTFGIIPGGQGFDLDGPHDRERLAL